MQELPILGYGDNVVRYGQKRAELSYQRRRTLCALEEVLQGLSPNAPDPTYLQARQPAFPAPPVDCHRNDPQVLSDLFDAEQFPRRPRGCICHSLTPQTFASRQSLYRNLQDFSVHGFTLFDSWVWLLMMQASDAQDVGSCARRYKHAERNPHR